MEDTYRTPNDEPMPNEPDFARGQDHDVSETVEEEIEREREGTFARGQEDLPEDTVEKDREGSFVRGQEERPEDTFEKIREGSFAEGQEAATGAPERVDPANVRREPPIEQPDPDSVRAVENP